MTAASLRLVAVALMALATAACGHAEVMGTKLVASPLHGTDGADHALGAGSGRVTILLFFARNCPCQSAHDARLRDLFATYHPRGVNLFAVDSETDATAERDAAEATKRGYPFPVLLDRGGALAKRMGAEYATETFVIDASGVVRYHGGIDSDQDNLHDDATPFLRDALDDLLAERPVHRAESKALGCALQTW